MSLSVLKYLRKHEKLKERFFPLHKYGTLSKGGKREYKRWSYVSRYEKRLLGIGSSISPSVRWGLFSGTGNCGYNASSFSLSGNSSLGPKDIRHEIAKAAVSLTIWDKSAPSQKEKFSSFAMSFGDPVPLSFVDEEFDEDFEDDEQLDVTIEQTNVEEDDIDMVIIN